MFVIVSGYLAKTLVTEHATGRRKAVPLGLQRNTGNVRLVSRSTGLAKDSVANVSQIVTLDRAVLTDRVGKLSRQKLELILAGIDVVLGR